MIHIKRTKEPTFLKSKRVKDAKDGLKIRVEDESLQARAQYNMTILRQVKPELMKMCDNKCAYCESEVGVATGGDVDNFRPKSGAKGMSGEFVKNHYWWLTYEWENLLLSCPVCNRRKSNFFPLKNEESRAKVYDVGDKLQKESAFLIDPCQDDPADHFIFYENGRLKPMTERGEVTIKVIGLNRRELIHGRKRASQSFRSELKLLVDAHSRLVLNDVKYVLENIAILLSDNPHQQYAGMLRYIFNNWLSENKEIWAWIENINVSEVNVKGVKTMSDIEKEKVHKVRGSYKKLKLFTIRSVEIQNFKSIEYLNLKLNPSSNVNDILQEAWLLLLGDNGVGKSSILQAIALCLSGRNHIEKLELDVSHYLKIGTKSGFVKIRGYGNSKSIILNFDTKGFTSNRATPVCYILGYGSTRLLPKGNIQPFPYKSPYVNIKNLFDYSFSLEDYNKWLDHIVNNEFHNRVAPALIDLLLLDGEDKLSYSDGELHMTHLGEEHLLEQMSDGYRSVAGLALDIMNTLSSDKADYHHSTGVVLIDEIGSHLHPRWKIKIVKALKKAFPKLQFIVSSHEPLCLRGIEKGEVGVLVRDEQSKVQILDSSLLIDHTMMSLEQLLTSDLFGLINVLDENAEKTYEEYYELLSKREKTQEDDDRILELSSEISKKELIGATLPQQKYYQSFHKDYVEKLINEGYKTTKELTKETKEEAKSLIDMKKLKWL